MSAIFGADKAQLLFCSKTRLFLSLFNCFDEGKKAAFSGSFYIKTELLIFSSQVPLPSLSS
ncbi:hypothetical protein HQ39_08550 [Porphyromonas sp. COT-108 OH2963]|nr:hypothetical protein HQ39_08550 [Porphyromonas sp. COT-108 OH2963]